MKKNLFLFFLLILFSVKAEGQAVIKTKFKFVPNFKEAVQGGGELCEISWVENPKGMATVEYVSKVCAKGSKNKTKTYTWASGARKVIKTKDGAWVEIVEYIQLAPQNNQNSTKSEEFSKLSSREYVFSKDNDKTYYEGFFVKYRHGSEVDKFMNSNQDYFVPLASSYNICVDKFEEISSSRVKIIFKLYPESDMYRGYAGCGIYGFYTFSKKGRFVISSLSNTSNRDDENYAFFDESSVEESSLKPSEFDLGRFEISSYIFQNIDKIISVTKNKDGFFMIFPGYPKGIKIVAFNPEEDWDQKPVETKGSDVIIVTRKKISEDSQYCNFSIVNYDKPGYGGLGRTREGYKIFNTTFVIRKGDYNYFVLLFPNKYMERNSTFSFEVGGSGCINVIRFFGQASGITFKSPK